VDETEKADEIDEAMQRLPSAAQAAQHPVGRGRRQHRQSQQSAKPDRQIDAQHDLTRDRQRIKPLIGDVEAEMQHDIGESADPDHAANQDETLPLQDRAQRGDRQRGEDQADRPQTLLVDRLVERPGAEIAGKKGEERPACRQEQCDKDRQLQRRQPPAVVVPRVLHRAIFRLSFRDGRKADRNDEHGPDFLPSDDKYRPRRLCA